MSRSSRGTWRGRSCGLGTTHASARMYAANTLSLCDRLKHPGSLHVSKKVSLAMPMCYDLKWRLHCHYATAALREFGSKRSEYLHIMPSHSTRSPQHNRYCSDDSLPAKPPWGCNSIFRVICTGGSCNTADSFVILMQKLQDLYYLLTRQELCPDL